MLRVGLNREDLIYGVEYNLTSPYTAYRRDEENYLQCNNRAAARRRWAKVLYCSHPRTAAVLQPRCCSPLAYNNRPAASRLLN